MNTYLGLKEASMLI